MFLLTCGILSLCILSSGNSLLMCASALCRTETHHSQTQGSCKRDFCLKAFDPSICDLKKPNQAHAQRESIVWRCHVLYRKLIGYLNLRSMKIASAQRLALVPSGANCFSFTQAPTSLCPSTPSLDSSSQSCAEESGCARLCGNWAVESICDPCWLVRQCHFRPAFSINSGVHKHKYGINHVGSINMTWIKEAFGLHFHFTFSHSLIMCTRAEFETFQQI